MEQQQGPRPRKPRRYTAPPQTVSDSVLLGVFDLPHGAGRPEPAGPPARGISDAADAGTDTDTDIDTDTVSAAGPVRAKDHAGSRGRKAAGPVLPERAAEDDPRRWGDAEEDLGEWMKSQRPPHWD